MFAGFRDRQYRNLLLLHEIYHSSADEEFRVTLQAWTDKKGGQLMMSHVLEVFQSPLEPEVLALALADIFLLWTLQPSPQDKEYPQRPSSLSDLEELLSQRRALKHSYTLLLSLLTSFIDALEGFDSAKSEPIVRFLSRDTFGVEKMFMNEGLKRYSTERLKGKSHRGTSTWGPEHNIS